MKRIRIGKDIAISWEINSPMDLVDTDLTIQMKDPKGNKVDIEDFELVDKTISFGLRGTAFAYLGNYTLTLWYKKGEVGQTVVDVVGAFELVGSTEQEDEGCNCGCGAIDVSTVDLYGDLTFPIIEGPKGDKGDKGDPGEKGEPGQNGEDGFSPIATVSKSGDTATITITDKNGTTTATVKDGSDASITIDPTPTQNSNNAVSSGGVYNAIASIPTPTPEIFWATYGTTTYAEIVTAYNAGKIVMCRDNYLYILYNISESQCILSTNSASANYTIAVNSSNIWSQASRILPNILGNFASSYAIIPSNYSSYVPTLDRVYSIIDKTLTKEELTGWQNGYYDTTTTPISDTLKPSTASTKCIRMEVNEGEVYCLNVKGGAVSRSYTIADASKTAIESANANSTLYNYYIKIPVGGKYLYLHSQHDLSTYKCYRIKTTEDVEDKIGQPVSFTYTYTDNTTVTYNLLTSNS